MPQFFKSSLCLYFFLFIAPPVTAQIIPDSTLPNASTVSTENQFLKIEGGTQRGNNLFHSFQQFSLPTGWQVGFQNSSTIQNIFSRVTGGNLSTIDGLIRSNGRANLFLLNPNGIIFGPNASLNVGGSFLATTADSIIFADGVSFSAVNPGSVLTISVPVGLNFGRTSDIQVQGRGHNLTGLTNPFSPIRRPSRPGGLAVPTGQTLALIGGNVILEGGILTAPSGQIALGSVDQGTVGLQISQQGWTFNYQAVSRFNEIRASQQSLLDASGTVSGTANGTVSGTANGTISGTANGTISGLIEVQGKKISLSDGSVFLIQNQGRQADGAISLVAEESLELKGSSANGSIPSNIRTESLSSGDGADIRIQSARVTVEEGAGIRTRTYGSGKGGDLTVNAPSIEVIGTSTFSPSLSSSINTSTVGRGNAGNLSIVSQFLKLTDGATVGSVTLGTGNAAQVTIKAAQIELSGSGPLKNASTISATTFGNGEAGNVYIDTDRLILRDKATINTASLGLGAAGSIRIKASDFVEVGPDAGILSSVVTTRGSEAEFFGSPVNPSGESGNITIDTRQLKVIGNSQVGVSNRGFGENAGILTINAQSIILENQGRLNANTRFGAGGNIFLSSQEISLSQDSQISAVSEALGNGGNIFINSGNVRILKDSAISVATQDGTGGNIYLNGDFLQLDSGEISASTQSGSGGNIFLRLRELNLANNSQIGATARNLGTGGTIDIRSGVISLGQTSRISTTTESGEGGNISITSQDIRLRNGSEISATAGGLGNGGNISLNTDFLVLFDDSRITANAFAGVGGNIDIRALGIFLSPQARITASSELGVDGTVDLEEVETLDKLFSQSVDRFSPIDAEIAKSCLVHQGTPRGTFNYTGSSGLPINPTSGVDSGTTVINIPQPSQEFSPSEPPNSEEIYRTDSNNGVNSHKQDFLVMRRESEWKLGDPIVEATARIRTADGRILLVSEPPDTPYEILEVICQRKG